MINLKKENNTIPFKKYFNITLILSFFLFSLYCIKQVYDYNSFPLNQVTYSIYKDQVYAQFNDGKHKSWDLKALAKNSENNKLYWINVTGADVYRGYATNYNGHIIPAGVTINESLIDLGNIFIALYSALIILILLFLPLWWDIFIDILETKENN